MTIHSINNQKKLTKKSIGWFLETFFIALVFITIVLVFITAYLYYRDSMLTLECLSSYICLNLASFVALIAALRSSQSNTVKGLLIVAIEFFIMGMFLQLLCLV